MRTTQILGLGTVVVDRQLIVDRFPEADTKVEALEERVQVGGPVPTALALLSRFGHTCRFAGVWGDDEEGRLIEQDLRSQQIEFPKHCPRAECRTGNAHVWVDRSTGTRTIVCRRSESGPGVERELLSGLGTQPVLQLDGSFCDAAIELARRTREDDGLVVLDTGSPKARTDELLQTADVVNAPRRFLTSFFDDDEIASGGRRLLERGATIVTITDGGRGAWIFTQAGEYHHQPAFEIEVADSTGAGDVFTGGLIHAVLQNWPADRMLRFASACAALKCTRLGNRNALPSVEEVEGFVDTNS